MSKVNLIKNKLNNMKLISEWNTNYNNEYFKFYNKKINNYSVSKIVKKKKKNKKSINHHFFNCNIKKLIPKNRKILSIKKKLNLNNMFFQKTELKDNYNLKVKLNKKPVKNHKICNISKKFNQKINKKCILIKKDYTLNNENSRKINLNKSFNIKIKRFKNNYGL